MRISQRIGSVVYLACAVFSVGWLTGCEEDIASVKGIDFPFTLYAALNPSADTQKVRVFPIEDLLTTGGESLDAAVRSVDRESGETVVWKDSLLRFGDGTTGYLFYAPFRVTYGHTYTLEVTRSDGATSTGTATVPGEVDIVIDPPVTTPSSITQTVFVNGHVPRIIRLDLVYQVRYDSLGDKTTTVVVPYQGKQESTGNGWKIDVRLDDDYDQIRLDLMGRGLLRSYGIVSLGITMRMMVVDEAWDPPGGVFDPEILVEPGIMTNVENGFGFVGSGYPVEQWWVPPKDALRKAGFRTL